MRSMLVLLGIVTALVNGHAATAAVPPDLFLEPSAGGFSAPVALRHAGDARQFVVEQGGRILIIDDGAPQTPAFLDFSANPPAQGFTSIGERGLLGLAFAPDYASSGRFYIYFTDGNGDSVVARGLVDADDPDRADPASLETVLRVDQPFSNHNGGDLQFGPDGYLYIGLGDGGSGNDPCDRAQTLAITALDAQDGNASCRSHSAFSGSGGNPDSRALLGKMLRIDVAANGSGSEHCGLASGGAGYAIPDDNPYAGNDGICNEVWAFGLRNPYRFSFDRQTGDLWIADVGQNAREEVNLLAPGMAGRNLGWRCREGDIATPGVTCTAPLANLTEPVLVYNHAVGESITGGYRYRGPHRDLRGYYLFADFISGRMFFGSPEGASWTYQTWRDSGGNPSGFGEDAAGNVYVLDYFDGSVSRIVTDLLFSDGFEPDS